MSIVSSVKVEDVAAQPDGSRYVIERHTDSTGRVHQVVYNAPAGFNTAARLAARAIELADALAEAEATEVTSG